MLRRLAVACAIALALVCAEMWGARSAHAAVSDWPVLPEPPAGHYAPLDALATRIAHRDVTVRCPTEQEYQDDAVLAGGASGVFGYVWFPAGQPVDYTIVRPEICTDALAISQGHPPEDEWAEALAVLVIVHESFHMWHIKGNGNESVTECRAIKTFPRAVVWLGGTEQLARNLLGEALAIHQWGLAPGYQLKSCKLPVPELP